MGEPTHKIVSVQFGTLSVPELLRFSAMEVTRGCLYEKGIPSDNAINSLELGTCDNTLRCKTCRHDVRRCPGHFGHLKLTVPCYHPLFIDHVVKLLRAVCFWCSRTLLPHDDRRVLPNLRPRSRFAVVCTASKGRKCPHCEGQQPHYVRVGMFIKADWPKGYEHATPGEAALAAVPFDAGVALRILRDITDEDAAFCGVDPRNARPESLVLTHLPVPPPIIRPSVAYQAGSRLKGQEDLTLKLVDIFKSNSALARAATPKDRNRHLEALQLHINLYIDKDMRPNRERSQAKAKGPRLGGNRSINGRFKGKKGRFRNNMIGKRTDFSSRGVITPGADLAVDEVGVPRQVALTQTVPERVTATNLAALQARVRRGPGRLDGAQSVVLRDGTLVNLAMCRGSAPDLRPGCVVNRPLRDGDWLAVNRQPTLHKGSMMAHRVRVVEDRSLRLNLCVTTPYNADFDGDGVCVCVCVCVCVPPPSAPPLAHRAPAHDRGRSRNRTSRPTHPRARAEMNLHNPQSWDARAELAGLMAVKHHILTDASSRPTVTMVQDCLIAMYHLTARHVLLDADDAAHVLGRPPRRGPAVAWRLPGDRAWTRRYTGKQVFSELLPPVNLRKRVRGLAAPDPFDPLERDVRLRGGALLTGRMCKEGMNSAGGVIHVACLDIGNAAAADFMTRAGRALHRWFRGYGFSIGIDDIATTDATYARVGRILGTALANVAAARASGAPPAAVEAHTTRVLQDILPRCGQAVLETLGDRNALRAMAKGCGAGSKGSKMNVAQMGALVGQQMVNSRRVGAARSGRTLPCFPPGDASPQARGLCVHPYTVGLTPAEFFFHAMGGREGLVDTAVKTASTGYIHRRLATYMKHHRLRYDGSVRNSRGEIIAVVYGDDGFKADRLERVVVPEIVMSDAEVRAGLARVPAVAELVLRLRASVRATRFRSPETDPARVHVPLNVDRLVRNVVWGRADLPFPEADVLAAVAWLDAHSWRASESLKLVLATGLARARTRDAAQQARILRAAKARILRAVCPPGYMAGTVAAQSIGEPTTQMCLNSFHSAGVASEMEMTSGVQRLKECIDISKNVKTPVTVVPVARAAAAALLARALPAVMLADVAAEVAVDWRPDPAPAVVLHDELRGGAAPRATSSAACASTAPPAPATASASRTSAPGSATSSTAATSTSAPPRTARTPGSSTYASPRSPAPSPSPRSSATARAASSASPAPTTSSPRPSTPSASAASPASAAAASTPARATPPTPTAASGPGPRTSSSPAAATSRPSWPSTASTPPGSRATPSTRSPRSSASRPRSASSSPRSRRSSAPTATTSTPATSGSSSSPSAASATSPPSAATACASSTWAPSSSPPTRRPAPSSRTPPSSAPATRPAASRRTSSSATSRTSAPAPASPSPPPPPPCDGPRRSVV